MGEGTIKSPPELIKGGLHDLEKGTDSAIEIVVRFFVILLGFFVSSVAFVQTFFNILKHKSLTGLFAPPKDRPLPPKVLTEYGQYKYIQLPNEWIFYIENGNVDAPVIIFLHGFPDFWYSWRGQIKHYAERYHIIAVDLRGYGYSEKYRGLEAYRLDVLANDLKNLIENLSKEKKAIVISHDWGALIVYHFLLKYPSLIEKYVTISLFPTYAFSFNIKQLLQYWYLFFFQLPFVAEGYLKQFDLDCPFTKPLYDKQPPEVVESYKFVYSKAGAFVPPLAYYRANIVTLVKYLIFGVPGLSSKPFPPGLAVYGDKDTTANPASYRNLSKVPHLEGKEIKGGDHFLHQKLPDEVNKAIDEFLADAKPLTPAPK